jgi:uncharacterized protein YjbJ (UPF0337 family)
MTNWTMVENQWNLITAQVKARWTRLTIAEIENIGGKRALLVAKLQENYGIFQLEAENQVNSWTTKFEKAANSAAQPPADASASEDPTVTVPAVPAAAPVAPGSAVAAAAPASEAKAQGKASAAGEPAAAPDLKKN